MTKYSSLFKIQVVQDYQSGKYSFMALAKKYNVSYTQTRHWFYTAEANGLESLTVKHSKKKFSLEEKVNVIDYYKNHNDGVTKVAAHFNINKTQVNDWVHIFDKLEIEGLRPKPRGRPITMKRKNDKVKKQVKIKTAKINKNESQEEKIIRLKEELYQAQMENDILKKLGTVLDKQRLDQKRK